jgi:hypothetical protein
VVVGITEVANAPSSNWGRPIRRVKSTAVDVGILSLTSQPSCATAAFVRVLEIVYLYVARPFELINERMLLD